MIKRILCILLILIVVKLIDRIQFSKVCYQQKLIAVDKPISFLDG